LEHGQRAATAVDAVIAAAGYTPVPVDRGGQCCGAAGIYQIEFPEVSAQLGRAKADRITDSGITTVVSANAGCEMQLRRFLTDEYRILHPIEVYRDRMRQDDRPRDER
ncbi:MAG: (Fe-S)-binding protein, partial [Armatimonadetes bacterium]